MAKYSGTSFSVLLVDQYNLIASTMDSASMEKEVVSQQTNPFGATSEQHTPIGLEKGVLTVSEGCFDPTTDTLHNVTGSAHGVSRIVSAAIAGNTIGKPFIGFAGAYDQKYSVMDRRDGLTMANVSYLVSGNVDEGVIIQDLASFTADWDTKTGGAGVTDAPVDYTLDPSQTPIPITSATKANPCVVTTPCDHRLTSGQKVLISSNTLSGPAINGDYAVTVLSSTTFSVAVNTSGSTGAGTGGSLVLSSTVAGGVGYFHCTAFAPTSLVYKAMHSPDDITYAALLTYTTLTAVGKERKTFAGTCDRYVSSNGDHTGSGSVTVFSGLCRN